MKTLEVHLFAFGFLHKWTFHDTETADQFAKFLNKMEFEYDTEIKTIN